METPTTDQPTTEDYTKAFSFSPEHKPPVVRDLSPGNIYRMLSTAAQVPSENVKGLNYLVRHADALDSTCTCPDFQYRGEVRPCKHQRAVRAALVVFRANFPTMLVD